MRKSLVGIAAFAAQLSVTSALCAEPTMPAEVSAQKTDAGVILATAKGMTLYTFDDDIGGNGSTCGGDCAETFPPLLAAADAKPIGAWSPITRADGTKQWAFKGAPVYTYAHDTKPGDQNGSAYIPVKTAIANDPMKQVWHVLWLPPALRPGIAIGAVKTGKILTDTKGMSLYASDRDGADGKSVCSGPCLDRWVPLAAPSVATSKDDWTVVARDDGFTQWAYRGKPLYTSRKDVKPGELKGDGEDGLWHAVVILPVPPAPPGVTLQTTDIGSVFADANGRTLYAWFQPLDHLKMTCNDDCMRTYWKPVPAPDGVHADVGWSAVVRDDGSRQLAYGGLPLYSFAQDSRPGDIAGYNFGYRGDQQSGAWQPVRPWY
jgi:predicted lipoprotein with Yx(FWY)xxD motif